jgi:chorismate synthase
VTRIGTSNYAGPFDQLKRDRSSVFCPDEESTQEMEHVIDQIASQGDTIGGEFMVVVEGLPAGIGSYTQWEQRLDALMSMYLMSIPAIKSVQIGAGVACGELPGSKIHDPIRSTRPKTRSSNNAGGLEGGVTNGEPVVIKCTMKPIPTLKKGMPTFDMRTGKAVQASYERSDVCAVPAASVVGEAMAIIAVSCAIIESYNQPSMDALKKSFDGHRKFWEGL